MSEVPEQAATVTANARLAIGDRKIEFKLVVPVGEVPPDALVEALQALTNTIVDGVEERATRHGYRISCQKGCGACCRQLVPISRPEARLLAQLVEDLPEPRRSEIRRRFDDAVRRLHESGMLDDALHFHRMEAKERETMAKSYFNLGIACPFLEDESCSIHPVRPFICREYVVVSSPKHCATLDSSNIDRLMLPAFVSSVFSRMEGVGVEGENPFLPLVLALAYVKARGTEVTLKPGPKWVQQFFQDLSGAEIPGPEAPETMLP